jgi:hypothetical protein
VVVIEVNIAPDINDAAIRIVVLVIIVVINVGFLGFALQSRWSTSRMKVGSQEWCWVLLPWQVEEVLRGALCGLRPGLEEQQLLEQPPFECQPSREPSLHPCRDF